MYAMYKSYHVSGKGWRAFLVHGLDSLGPNFTASVCSVCDGHGRLRRWLLSFYGRVPVFKAPFGDPGKASKKGRQAVVWDYQFQDYFSVAEEQYPDNLLKEVWRAGEFKREYTLDDVRKLASQAS